VIYLRVFPLIPLPLSKELYHTPQNQKNLRQMAKKTPEENPFVQIALDFTIYAIWKSAELRPAGAPADMSLSNSRTFAYTKFEVNSKASVYSDNGLLNIFPTLPSAAKDMFMYIVAKIQYESDVIELEEEKYMETMGVSRATFYSARKALTNRIIMERKERKNTYWVNPAYIFRGSRISKYPKNVKMVDKSGNPVGEPKLEPPTDED